MYLALNVLSFLVFANDKRKAVKNIWRTSENRLLLFALLGPFGAFTAMKTVRHKINKIKFLLVYIFLIVHIAVLSFIFMNYYSPEFFLQFL